MTDRPGCLDTLSRPSCFGFLLLIALWFGLCGAVDLVGPRLAHHPADSRVSLPGRPG